MTIAQNSVFLRLLMAVGCFIGRAWRNSALCRWLDRLEAWAVRQARGSVIFRFLWREGTIPKSWPHSISCRLFTGILNLPCALVKWLYKAGRRVWESSLFCRFLALIGGGTFFFLGLFMMAMLMAPHESWNTVYGLLGAVCLLALFVVGSASRTQNRLELDRLGPYMIFYMGFICAALAASVSTRLSMRFFFFHLTGFLLVLFGCCMVADNPYWWVSVAISGTGCALIALAVFVLPKDEDEARQDKRLVVEDDKDRVVLLAPLTDFDVAYLRALKLGKDNDNE